MSEHKPPTATWVLCLLTVGVSVAQSVADDGRWAQAVGVIPAGLLDLRSLAGIGPGQVIPVWLTLFTYVFLHGGWWYVLPNMAGLWVFGTIAEPAMGTRRFVFTYLASGAFGAFVVAVVLPHSLKPMAGASLAISGILGAYLAFSLSSRIRRGPRSRLVLVLEAVSVVSVAAWLVFRTVPAEADLACSVIYHFIPFMAAWSSVRISERLRGLKPAANGRAAPPQSSNGRQA